MEVLVASVAEHSQHDSTFAALDAADEFVRQTPGGIAVIKEDGQSEALAVIYDGWVTVAPE